MKTDPISITAIAVSVIAIIMAGSSIAIEPDTNTDNLATSAELKSALNRISEVEKLEMPTNFVTPTELSNGVNGIASHVDALISIMTEQDELMEQLQVEIITNRNQIDDYHPVDFVPEAFVDEPIEGVQITPLVGIGHQITVMLEKAEWLKGELVSISGEARVAQGQVQLTITQPDGDVRNLNAIVTDNGRYQIFFGTDFKLSPIGEYTVFVQQRNSTSETISFMLVE
jgi:hypothetical protein